MESFAIEEEENRIFGNDKADLLLKDVQCMTFTKRRTGKKEHHSWWKQPATTKLQKQLQARWKSQEVIEFQLESFLDFYRNPPTPTTLREISDVLSPGPIPFYEQATLTWFGDWRPSAILELLRGRAFSSSDSDHVLTHLINDVAIEESIIDSELAEIRATCVFHLPFAPASRSRSLESVIDEFRKIQGVIIKAQQLRFKTLQKVVKRVLNPTEAAEFLVGFAGLQSEMAAGSKGKNQTVLSLPSGQFKS